MKILAKLAATVEGDMLSEFPITIFFKKDSISDTVLAKCKTANACLLKRIAQKWKRKLTKSSLDNKMKVLAYSLIGEKIKTLMVHSKEKIRVSQLQVRDAN